MSDYISILIAIYDKNGKQLLKTAIKAKKEILTDEVIKYYKEPENEKILNNLLPLHCRGEIVEVKEIFDIKTYK